MNLKPDTEKALDNWMLISTWDSGHPLDWDRFYQFVDQYQKDHGFSIDEPALRDIMKSKVGDQYEQKINEYIGLAYKILDFLKVSNR